MFDRRRMGDVQKNGVNRADHAAWRLFALVLSGALLLVMPVLAGAAPRCVPVIDSVAAAPDQAPEVGLHPPPSGWEGVTLPDIWTRRWPNHDGAVWYRVKWSWHGTCPKQGIPEEPVAMQLGYLNMAGEVYLNHELLWRDAHLTEPMSRSWNQPRYWVLPRSAMTPEDNTLWFRVLGHPVIMPGLGTVRIGDPAQLQRLQTHLQWSRRTVFLVDMTGSIFLAFLFAGVALLYRKKSIYGWFVLLNLSWSAFIYNVLTTQTWPFRNAVDIARANSVAFMIFCLCFTVVLSRLQGMVLTRRLVTLLSLVTLAGTVIVSVAPVSKLLLAVQWTNRTHLLMFGGCCLLVVIRALRTRTPSDAFYAALALVYGLIAFHDGRAFHFQQPDAEPLIPYAHLLTMSMLSIVLGRRMANSLRRTEQFNRELSVAVQKACEDLEDSLEKKHELALANSRLQERIQFVHDIHDGFGSALVRAIVQVEKDNESGASKRRYLSTLKSLRDDLRNVIDGGRSFGVTVPATPTEWLAPVRRRFADLFDEVGIESRWSVPPAWPQVPSALKCLTLTRVLEEALSNALKHSRATHVAVTLDCTDPNDLTLCVEDDGVGFKVDQAVREATGVGLQSMQSRISRLGGQLTWDSRPGRTLLRASLPA